MILLKWISSHCYNNYCEGGLVMEFDKARDSSNNIISFKYIKTSNNLDKLRKELKCPTKNCQARLSYVAARKPYLKTHNKSSHSSFCPYKKQGVKYRNKQRKKLLVSLNENSVYSRLDRYKNDFYPNLKAKTIKQKNNNKRKQKTKNSVQNAKLQGVASVNSKTSVTKNVISPRVSKKHLNEFLSTDKGKIFQLGAKLKKIIKYNNKKYIFKIEDRKNRCNGEILLKKRFFSRNVQGINLQLDFLMNYLKKNPNNNVNIAFYGTLLNFNSMQFEIFVDYGFKLYEMRKGRVIKNTLAEFYSLHFH